MRPPLAALAPLVALLTTAGCLGPGAWRMQPLEIDIDVASPTAQLETVRHDAAYDLATMTARVHVEGTVRLEAGVSGPRVELYLAEGRCPMGPAGAPEESLDKEVVEVPASDAAATRGFEGALSARMAPGTPYAVYALAQPPGLGPNFAHCVSGVAA